MIKCTITKSVAGVENGSIKYNKVDEVKVFASVKSLNNYKEELVAKHELPIKVDIKELFFDKTELENAIKPLAEKLDNSVINELIANVERAFVTGCLVKRD